MKVLQHFARISRMVALLLAVHAPLMSFGQQIDSRLASEFTLTQLIGNTGTILDVNAQGNVVGTVIDGQITQMAFGPDNRLYLAIIDGSKGGSSETEGIWRFDYNPAGVISNPFRVSERATTALAFHNSGGVDYMYITDAFDIFGAGGFGAQPGIMRRMTDTNGDGYWGESGDTNQILIDNVPVAREHRMNQITFSGDTLYTGIGSMATDGSRESAYTAAVGFIEDITQVGPQANAARIGSTNSFITPERVLTDDISPFLNTDPDKLRTHSIGVRNPFGIVTDGDGNVWATMNNDQSVPALGGRTPADLFFKLEYQANYGFAQKYDPDAQPLGHLDNRGNGNEIPLVTYPGVGTDPGEAGFSETKNVTSTTTESPNGFFGQYDPANPNGSLGPSAAVGGVDFATSNNFLLRWHKDAFIGRWSYSDIVAVDLDTGEIHRIAHGFNRSMEVVADPFGNILVSEAPTGDTQRARIFRIAGVRPRTNQPHLIQFLNQTDSDWSDRLAWGGDFDDNGVFDPPFLIDDEDKLVPHQWGQLKYDVTINRQVANLTITLDQHAHVNNLLLGNELRLTSGNLLRLDNALTLTEFGLLKGNGDIEGNVIGQGTIAPGDSVGMISVVGNVATSGTVQIDVESSTSFDQFLVSGTMQLDGDLEINVLQGFVPVAESLMPILHADGGLSGTFADGWEQVILGGGLYLDLVVDENTASLLVGGVEGDFNLDGVVNAADYALWRDALGTEGAGLAADGNLDGIINAADQGVWKSNFGAIAEQSGAATQVPCPSGLAQVICLSGLMIGLRRWW